MGDMEQLAKLWEPFPPSQIGKQDAREWTYVQGMPSCGQPSLVSAQHSEG